MKDASLLTCPKDQSKLIPSDKFLMCKYGHSYPIIEDIPVLLNDSSVDQTMDLVKYSLYRANGKIIDKRQPELYLETLGINEEQKKIAIDLYNKRDNVIDPIVSVIIGATSGHLYKNVIGKLYQYPIPELRLPKGGGKLFLDIGCNWGRWSIAAARNGYRVIGIDPSLGAVLAAKRVARQLGLDIFYICGDSRYIPISAGNVDVAFSYSVFQHFSKVNVEKSLSEIKRILKEEGVSLIQMPNKFGVRSLYHQLKRGFREPKDFEVRYWSPSVLKNKFNEIIGLSKLYVDGYFGLGIQKSDASLLPPKSKIIIYASEILRKVSNVFAPLKYIADSLYITSIKKI